MGRIPCCDKDNVKRGQWTPEEDNKLSSYIALHGTRNWRLIPKNAGLQRCGKSCRLRWTNYLRPDLKHGQFSNEEEQIIVKLHSVVGNRWSVIASRLPGRTDNDVKNHWNTKLKKKLTGMGIDPITHKLFSHLMTEIANTLAAPQSENLAEATLGCFKDEMFHLLTKKCIDFQSNAVTENTVPTNIASKEEEDDESIEKIKLGLSRAIQKPSLFPKKPWDPIGESANNFTAGSSTIPASVYCLRYGTSSFSNDDDASLWNSSMCTGGLDTGGDQQKQIHNEQEHRYQEYLNGDDHFRNGSSIFSSDCTLWDLPSDDATNPFVKDTGKENGFGK